ncbi:MAG: HD-GYP domain-containing protein [Candidatus Eremiobacteraeota bacterium]|nr:HD-GYP domain-containing protein [Candidatus Eremiobacteraeota bacterium]
MPSLTKSAVDHVTLPSLARDPELESALTVLLDRLCLSLTLARPVGLVAWAGQEIAKIGRAGVVDLTSAATHALSLAATAYDVEQRRVLAFLEILTRDVERAALGADGDEDIADSSHDESTTALLAMLAERDYGTCCHSQATAQWTLRLATALGCETETAKFIELCALLHDIGKISTPDAILLKPEPLTSTEWEVMREHAASGARILSQIPSLARCAAVVRAHHERFDGAGYPDGLSGTSIPLEARIVSVADAFHAMISERPYRKPVPPRRALEILAEGRGTQWDPDIVDAMLGMFSRRATVAPHEHERLFSA